MEVIGYEGPDSTSQGYPMLWGGAAIRLDNGRIINSVLGGPGISQEEWDELVAEGDATQTQVFFKIKKLHPFFVVDMRIDLLDREPYTMSDELKEIRGVLAEGRGSTRGYYAFRDHDILTNWLYHLHATKFELTPSR